ncbi:hypothetical protein ACFLSZ_05915 [Candidatus Bipolaricaulota bacterium]
MGKDAFYDAIELALGGHLDPLLFEECCVDLLSRIFPGISHVAGGSDGGVDGAIPDAEGEPLALVCTTSNDVIGNFTKSLNRMMLEGDPNRKVFIATSDVLTPLRRKHLFLRAREKGFTLINVFQRTDLARYLYNQSAWCKTLLNLEGDLPALSALPPRGLAIGYGELIGRHTESEWLESRTGDCVLVGQPGSGKTSLLRNLVEQQEGLFVADKNPDRIAHELREKEPSYLLLDDAGETIDMCSRVRQMRNEIGASFGIVAACWPNDLDEVLDALELGGESVLRLGRLLRKEVVQVIAQAGITRPARLVREILDQSRGRPGLATMLSRACLEGSIGDVWRGDLMKRRLLIPQTRRGKADETHYTLGCLALGGETGMSLSDVASLALMAEAETRLLLADIGASGIIDVTSSGSLRVYPRALRHVLVRDIWVNALIPLDLGKAIGICPNRTAALLTVIGAVARGGNLDPAQLGDLIGEYSEKEVWCSFASLRQDYCDYALKRHPEIIESCTRGVLQSSPKDCIPLMLNRAIGDNRPLRTATDHPIRIIADWIGEAGANPNAIDRRTTLVQAVDEWQARGGDDDTALLAFSAALRPDYEFHETSPADEFAVTVTNGYLGASDLESLARIGAEKRSFLDRLRIADWSSLIDCLGVWVHPYFQSQSRPPQAWRKAQIEGAALLVESFAEVLASRPGAMRSIAVLALDVEIVIDGPSDNEFDLVYPSARERPSREALEAQRSEIEKLAVVWSEELPVKIADKLRVFEEESLSAGHVWPRWSPQICSVISKTVFNPDEWAEAFISRSLGGGMLSPFLRRLIADRHRRCRAILARAFSNHMLEYDCILAILASDEAGTFYPIIEDGLPRHSKAISGLVLGDEITDTAILFLLEHEHSDISGEAASALWMRHDHEIPSSLRPAWRRAVLAQTEDLAFLESAFSENPDLAYEWLVSILGKEPIRMFRVSDILVAAISVLNKDSRGKLIGLLEEPPWLCWDIARLAVNGDQDLYDSLLAQPKAANYRTAPLEVLPDDNWKAMALKAYAVGCGISDIASAPLRWLSLERINESGPAAEANFLRAIKELEKSSDLIAQQIAEQILDLMRTGGE